MMEEEPHVADARVLEEILVYFVIGGALLLAIYIVFSLWGGK